MQPLSWIPVESSVLASIAYEPRALWVLFRSGEIYRYRNVPLRLFRELLAANSVGRYFNANIRDRFPYDHITTTGNAGAA